MAFYLAQRRAIAEVVAMGSECDLHRDPKQPIYYPQQAKVSVLNVRTAGGSPDPQTSQLAPDRLAAIAKSYDDLANGSEYLRRYPDGPFVVPVIERLNVLADNLYGEVVLYQSMGDSVKAMERINKILTNAPLSPAAGRLRDRAVLTASKT